MRLSAIASGLLALASVSAAAAAGVVKRAALTQVSNYGGNTAAARMYIYVPDRLATKPAIVVAIHYCTGTAQAFYSGTPYARQADQHGFIVIYPESPYSGGCWDVSSPSSLTRNGGGSSTAISRMVTYALNQYGADASRVFVTGTSSGAMMTNVMAATYPDMFAAASAYAGVPAGCFYTGTVAGWNSTCANGQEIHSQQAWAQTALNMYPGYTGNRPKMLILHGSADATIYPQNFNETLKQWAGVHGYTYGSPQQTLSNNPQSGYTKYVYGPKLVGVYGSGVGHNIPIFGDQDLEWFGLTGNSAPAPTTTTTAAPTTAAPTGTPYPTTGGPSPTPTTVPAPCGAARWGQCGGNGWTGCTSCASPWTCQEINDWYHQCL